MESDKVIYSKQYAEFLTVTCLEWKPILEDDRFKNIVLESLSFLFKSNRATIYAFVIMQNHFHLIWQISGDHKRDDVQRDFLKFTSQQILKVMRIEQSSLRNELFVQAKDRKYQVWERNSLGSIMDKFSYLAKARIHTLQPGQGRHMQESRRLQILKRKFLL